MVFTPALQAYRVYQDDGAENASTALANQNTAPTIDVSSGNVTIQVRIQLQETGGAAGASTDDWAWQRSINGGAFSTVLASTAGCQSNASSQLTDGGSTTERLTGGTGSFIAGIQKESGSQISNFQLTASNRTEFVYGMTVVAADLSNGDQITFRTLYQLASPITQTNTPTINITKVTAAPSLLYPPPPHPNIMALLVR